MRCFIYFLFSVVLLSSCRGIFYNRKNQKSPVSEENNKWTSKTIPPAVLAQLQDTKPRATPTPPELMNELVKEIRFDIQYYPKHTEEEKKRVKIRYNNCLFRNPNKENRHEYCHIKVRTEDHIYFKYKSYCYDIKKDKETPFNKSLKAKLYDKNGNILAKDYLRCDRNLDGTDDCHKETQPSLNFYFPYFKTADRVEVIKIEDGKEIVVKQTEYFSYSIYDNKILNHKEIQQSKTYFKESNCHHIRFF